MQLKLRRRTLTLCKGAFEVSESLKQRLSLQTLGRLLPTAQPGSQPVQATPQLSAPLIEALQSKGQAHLLGGRFKRQPRQQLEQPGPQSAGAQGVARQDLSRENGEAAATAATLAPVATPDPLAALRAALSGLRLVAVKLAVAV